MKLTYKSSGFVTSGPGVELDKTVTFRHHEIKKISICKVYYLH